MTAPVGPLPVAKLVTATSNDSLCRQMTTAPVADPSTEILLTRARLTLLNDATAAPVPERAPEILRFYGALAEQCFINEYVFAVTDDEVRRADALRNSLETALRSGTLIDERALLAVASYFPLHGITGADQLLSRQEPAPSDRIVRQQIVEPAREKALTEGIPRLTAIDDPVSLKVQQQYTENPYPRWIEADPAGTAKPLDAFMAERFPQACIPFPLPLTDVQTEILIAGCGTGLHPINTARRFCSAHVLAIDLSLPSLGYARRKAEERGLTSINFAQADLLNFALPGTPFDLIESVGVLQHLQDPAAGVRALASLLRAGGFMHLGLYSRIARRDIDRARHFIARRGYKSTPDDIRRCRQDLLNHPEAAGSCPVTQHPDFFCTSTCRDLLFHVQETCITLPELKQLLAENGLNFLGFDIDPAVNLAYRRRFPDDPSGINLDGWHAFEQDHPQTFIGMYQFWMQKPRAA